MPDEQTIDSAVAQSVQTPATDYFGAVMTSQQAVGSYELSLPPIDHPYRQALLYRIALHPQSSMWSSAVAGLITQVQATPWRLMGKRRVGYFQDILLDAQYGDGWDAFIQAVLWDYFNNDDGAFIQVIGPGNADRPLPRELITGLSVLSALHCYGTGIPEYPTVYYDAYTGQMHKMHRSRVIRMVDQPLSDPRLRGRGVCALSRAITYVQQAMVTASYIGGSLSNQPPPGLLIWNGAIKKTVDDAWSAYRAGIDSSINGGFYKPAAEYINVSNEVTTSASWLKFSTAPEGFNATEAEKTQAAGIARALGIDVQDVLALQGGPFGTGTQSVILSKKAEGRALGATYKLIERNINTRVLPDNLQFKFTPRNVDKQESDARVTELHARVAQMLAALPGMPEDAALRYLATNDEAMGAILLDENGELVTAYDDDVEVTTEDVTEADEAFVTDADNEVDNSEEAPIVDYDDKALDPIADAFISRFTPVVAEVNAGNVSSRRLDTILRSLLKQYGQRAMLQGLKDGGVDATQLEGSDLKAYHDWYASNSRYVTEFVSRTFGYGDGLVQRSDAQVAQSARLWANKSLRDAYLLGVASADANGMYEWRLGPTEEHCSDCSAFNGQRHRFSVWKRAGALPGSSALRCGGYECKCELKRVNGRSRGRIVWQKHHHEHAHPYERTAA